MQLSGIPFWAIAPKIGHPFTYIAALAVLSDKFGPLRSHRVHSTRSFGHQIGLSPDRSKPLVWQVWIGRDDVLGFQLSTGHSSIVLRCVNNRLPEHQSEQAHHCYGDCNGECVFAWYHLNLLWWGDMKKGYQLGAKQLCETAHTTCHVA